VLNAPQFDVVPVEAADESNTKMLGRLLYTVYVYPFEIASVILTVAIVAAITLTLREHKRKLQDVGKQVAVRREDRVRLVNLRRDKAKGEETP
jgi:NADH-quinone oxidoreductase subunit J